jgi:hypothetical protein
VTTVCCLLEAYETRLLLRMTPKPDVDSRVLGRVFFR